MLVGVPVAEAPAPKGDDAFQSQLATDMDGVFSVLQAITAGQEVLSSAMVLEKAKSIELFRYLHTKDLADKLINEVDIALGVSGGYKTITDDPSKDNYTTKNSALKCTGYGLMIGLKAGDSQIKTIDDGKNHCYFKRIGGTGVGSEMSGPDI